MVTFIVVARNSAQTLPYLLKDLGNQEYDHQKIEVLLIDGMSSDGTMEIMEKFRETHHDFARITVMANPRKTLPAGWNIALSESRGDIILRVDAHASIPQNFVRLNVESIESGEHIVGGQRISISGDTGLWPSALLLAESSMFGSGIASYRRKVSRKYVSTLAHAAYSRNVFVSVGGYDERLVRTEDNEIHYRMKKEGYNFYYNPSIKSFHYVRSNLTRMAKQKFLNGYWIGLTCGVSPRSFAIYHFAPLIFILAASITLLLAVYGTVSPLILGLCLYVPAIAISMGKSLVSLKGLSSIPIIVLLHLSYGTGTLCGLLWMPFWVLRGRNTTQTGAGVDPFLHSTQKGMELDT